jgi:hypothetical protein
MTSEFDANAAFAADRRSQRSQPLPLPPTPPAVAPPPQTGATQAGAGPLSPEVTASIYPSIRDRLPENNPWVAEAVRIAEKYDLPRDVFLALVQRESNFNPTATSNRGAIGLTQLMPDTARELGVDPRDPAANLDAGARYLRQQITRFGSLPLALAAYNAGPRRVTDAGNQVPRIEETVKFVDNILRNAGMEGYLHPQHDPEKGYAEGGLASLDQKYADGGTVRRPAAAPVPRPSDEDYLSILADRAVGAGEPVAELRSSEGRGFAPMPFQGEGFQRMSAMLRGEVEPTPGEQMGLNIVRGFTEGPASIRAYHGSPYRFRRFDISKAGSTTDEGQLGRALYFTTDKAGIERLNAQGAPVWPNRYEVDLNIENPLQLKLPSWFADKRRLIREELNLPMDASAEEVAQKIISRGHDSVSLDYSPVKYYHQELGVFDPDLINLVRRYEEGGMVREPATAYDPDEIDRIVQEFAEGGEVEAPAETTISGQDHKLAYITDREAALLKARGGSGRMTRYGIRAYDDANGDGPGGSDSDSSNSNSEAGAQDAAGGNAGQGAGPTGAGAGATGEAGPGPTSADTGVSGPGMSNADPEGTQAAANAQTANQAQQQGLGFGIADTGGFAPTGFNAAPGIAEAIGAYSRGDISLAEAIGYGLQSGLAPPGVTPGISVNEVGVQTPAVSVDPLGLGLGLAGLAVGVPGLGALGGFIGSQISNAVGLSPSVFSSNPNEGPAAPSDMGGGEYSSYGQMQYGVPTSSTLPTSAPSTASSAPTAWDWNEIQRQATLLGMSVDEYMASRWKNLPLGMPMKKGGLADLHAKYADGGEVEDNGGVERYDPREIDALASEFMAESNPADLMQRSRMMLRGMNVGMPTNVGALNLSDNENVSNYTGLREMPIEDDRFSRALRTLNTGINATLDQERNIRLGAGLLAMQDASDRGMSGYGANLSAGYGPLSLQGGYQAAVPGYPSAKSQGVYTYGGNLNIPLDEEGVRALLGAQVMSGRRGSAGMGNAGTLITGGLERPFLDGTLGVDVSVDPTLRNKEILFGYRRAF